MRVMIIGASQDRSKFGNKALRAYARQGHTVLPVNPRGGEIEGFAAYPAIASVPGPIDRATLYLHPEAGVRAVNELAARGDVGELWLNPGADAPEVIAEAERMGFTPIVACSIVDIGESPR
jgi:predicted CoA-binding protein